MAVFLQGSHGGGQRDGHRAHVPAAPQHGAGLQEQGARGPPSPPTCRLSVVSRISLQSVMCSVGLISRFSLQSYSLLVYSCSGDMVLSYGL